MKKANKEILDYIENELLPKYNGIGGHTDEHIRQVMARSEMFMEQAGDVNPDMVMLIAAYHDLGRLVDNKTHNFESAKMLRADKFLQEHFDDDQINIMAEAVEDHRSTLGHEPRSIYGKIVSSADRNTNLEVALNRVYDSLKFLEPDKSDDEIFEEGRVILRNKYSTTGYAASAIYFDDPNFHSFLVTIEDITENAERFAGAMRACIEKRKK